ncbi:MAG: M1 family metallopeptidase [Asticcacaulis sp.]
MAACKPVQPSSPEGSVPLALVKNAVDAHSYAKPNTARVRHVDLNLTADFKARVLKGTAALTLETDASARQVILDIKALDILRVADASGAPLKFTIGKADPVKGSALIIDLPQGAQKVIVTYQTTAETEALQWLEPSQTAGGKYPFLFSQGQSILTRTWIPTQDSPMVRQTYTANITVPRALKAVMSADMLTPDGEAVPGQPDQRVYRFRMDEAIPPYLIALAVGNLEFRSIGKRTGVYAEPVTIRAAASEFADMEKMLLAAEKLYGPYRWGRYDVLVLPPSFPYGGMENPRLTFATPTILAGDKSLVSLIAHELAHSWSGNLVTNGTWDDFWLNEGFTVYFENRIMEEIYGKERALTLQSLGFSELKETLAGLKEDELQKLHIRLKGRHPDEGFSDVPYEKGAAFLRMLEAQFGRQKLDAYLKGYFERYAFQSMTTEAFLADLREHLLRNDRALEDRLHIQAWLNEPGLPDNAVAPVSRTLNLVEGEAAAFAQGVEPSMLRTSDWETQAWLHFLKSLPADLSDSQLESLDKAFKLTNSGNSEIRFAWYRLVIAHHYEPALPSLENFLTSQGRRKFIAPLYTDLMAQSGWGEEMARRVYAKARSGYHQVTRETVDKIVS